MNRHIKHLLQVLLPLAVSGGSAVIADPSFAHYVAQHPGLAVYVPMVSAALLAAAKGQPYVVTITRKAPAAPPPAA